MIAGANVVEQKLLKATIEAIVVDRPDPEEAEQNLNLDKGYDNPRSREAAAEAGYVPHIRRIGEEKKSCDRSKGHKPRRWVVERTFAWLGRYRRNSRDYEYYTTSSESMIRISSIHRMLKLLRPDLSKPAVPFKYRESQGIITG